MVERQIYEIKVFYKKENYELDSCISFKFSLKPEFEIVKVEKIDYDGNIVKELELDEDEERNLRASIKSWIFRINTAPIIANFRFKKTPVEGKGIVWKMVPSEFTEEDKQKIKHMYLLEEL